MRFAILIVSIGVLLGLGMFMASVGRLERALIEPSSGQLVQRVVVVAPGSSAPQLVKQLQEEGLVNDEGWLSAYAESLRDSTTFVAGEYALNSQMSPIALFQTLETGQVIRHTFSFEPGVTASDVTKLIVEMKLGDADALARALSSSKLLEGLGVQADSLEGFLFPDIYRAPKGLSSEQILGQLTARFAEEVAKHKNGSGHPLYDVVRVASLIEMSEVPVREQRMYAALLYNRLAKKVPLDHPKSAAYGKRKGFGVGSANPYNTKRNKGLPPTPICNPGAGSLQAAFNPLKTDAIYKVKREDGSHYYCPDRACAVAAERARKGLSPIDRTVRRPLVVPAKRVPTVFVPGGPLKPEPPSESMLDDPVL